MFRVESDRTQTLLNPPLPDAGLHIIRRLINLYSVPTLLILEYVSFAESFGRSRCAGPEDHDFWRADFLFLPLHLTLTVHPSMHTFMNPAKNQFQNCFSFLCNILRT